MQLVQQLLGGQRSTLRVKPVVAWASVNDEATIKSGKAKTAAAWFQNREPVALEPGWYHLHLSFEQSTV